LLKHEQARIFFDQRRCLVGDARLSQLRIPIFGKGRCGCEIEASGKHTGDPIGFVDRSLGLVGLNRLKPEKISPTVTIQQVERDVAAAKELATRASLDLKNPK
jgi:hypothetical protein